MRHPQHPSQLRGSEVLAQEPEGRDMYGLITGLLILICMLPVGPTEEGKAKGLSVNKSAVDPITQPARLASGQRGELG